LQDLTALAFTLGVDELALARTDEATEGALLTVLSNGWEIPEISLHAELDLAAQGRRAERRQSRVVSALAEMGLVGRPLHVWLGSPAITDCLSPYTRELREPMLAWAETNP